MKTGQWFTTTKPKSNLWLRLDYDECLDYFKNISTNLDYFKRFFSKNEIKDIYYDELLENTEKKLDELQNFLGVDKKPMKTPLKKQTNQPLSDTILNYSELKRKFSSTKWAAFFED
jgi:LPS sulfotransferase NodH